MNDNILLNIIRGFVSFVLSILIFVCTTAFWAQCTILNSENVSGYIKEEFYGMLYTEVCDNITENTVSTGLPEDILTAPLTEDIVKSEMNASINCLYSGTKYQLATDSLKTDYKNVISVYAQENGLELDEAATDSLVNYIVKLIEDSIKIPFSNTLSPYFLLVQDYIGKIAMIMLAATAAVLLFLFFLCRPRSVMLRYIGRALMCCGILGGFVSLYVTTQEIASSVNIASLAYSNAILSITKGTFNSLLIVSVIFFTAGIILSLVPVKTEQKEEAVFESDNENEPDLCSDAAADEQDKSTDKQ